MNKALEALKRIKTYIDESPFFESELKIIEADLERLDKLEHWNEVCEDKIATLETTNKRLGEILRIIKEKNVDVFTLSITKYVQTYNDNKMFGSKLTQPLL